MLTTLFNHTAVITHTSKTGKYKDDAVVSTESVHCKREYMTKWVSGGEGTLVPQSICVYYIPVNQLTSITLNDMIDSMKVKTVIKNVGLLNSYWEVTV